MTSALMMTENSLHKVRVEMEECWATIRKLECELIAERAKNLDLERSLAGSRCHGSSVELDAVSRFAAAMVRRLESNRARGHWGRASLLQLLAKVFEQAYDISAGVITSDRDVIKQKAVDAANYAMMMFDIAENRR